MLVAVAIPVFTAQLEKSRDATTIANLRSAYAEAQASYISEVTSNGDVKINSDATTKKITSIQVKNVKASGTQTGFSDAEKDLPFTAPTALENTPGYYVITFNYGDNGISSVTASSASATKLDAFPTT